jgi:hypothetical protein
MNDAYPEGFPRYASRAQLKDENDDTEAEASLPACLPDGSNKPGCVVKKALKMCANNVAPNLKAGEEQDCIVWKNCADHPGLAAGTECYAPGVGSGLAQLKDENDDTEAEASLPACLPDGSNKPGCVAKKAVPMCKNNLKPDLKDGQVQNCVVWPACADNAGLAAGIDCYAPGVSALLQT